MEDRLTVSLDEADLVEAYRPHPRTRRLGRLLLLLAIMLGISLVALVVRVPEARSVFAHSPVVIGLTGAVLVVASLVTGLLLTLPALRLRAARSTLNDHPGMRELIHYTFDPDQFSVQTTYTHAAYPWEQLWGWRETERIVIVMPTPRNFYVIPKRAAGQASFDRLRTRLARCKNAGKQRREMPLAQ